MIARYRCDRIRRVRGSLPMMDDGARGWLIKYAKKNLWRVSEKSRGESLDPDDLADLIQDGYLWYAIVRDKYPQARDKPHIMQLFKVTFANYINDLSKHRSRMDAIMSYDLDIHDPTTEQQLGQLVDMGDGYFIPNSAPWYVHAFLRLLCSPEGQRGLRRPYRVRLSGVREETHARLCKLIGADPETTPTLPDALERYFASV